LKFKFLSRFNSQKNTSIKNLNLSTIDKYPFKNPLGNFLAGFVDQLAYGYDKFYQCFPKSWLEGNQADKQAEGETSGIIGGWVQGLKAFVTLNEPLIQFFCKFKDKVIKFISSYIIKRKLRKLRKFRIMIESGKGTTKAFMQLISSNNYGWNWDLGLGDAVSWVANKAGNLIKDAVFNSWFDPIKKEIEALINKIKDFFTTGFMKTVKNCIDSFKEVKGKLAITFNGLKGKFKSFNNALKAGTPGMAIFVVDFLVALICKYQYLLRGITFISKGSENKDKNGKTFEMGKGIGVLLRTFATAPTMAEKMFKSKAFKKLFFK